MGTSFDADPAVAKVSPGEILMLELIRHECAAGSRVFDLGVGEAVEALLGILVVDADAALDRHRPIRRVAHGAHALGHEVRLGHQAGAKAP
jgi:hypothetical protein